MKSKRDVEVAVLLATHNGSRYVSQQIESLQKNSCRFTLHWLDDCSCDDTREVVRASARRASIELIEWHQAAHIGLPSTFFTLLENVEADIYMFCDQDDIWEAGKIDATVSNLAGDLMSVVLCFSDTILFHSEQIDARLRLSDALGKPGLRSHHREFPTFMMFSSVMAAGHTQGFTRPLREMFMGHRDIAHKYAYMHDWWMHDIAVAAGTARMLSDIPTALWRQHQGSFCALNTGTTDRVGSMRWRKVQHWRAIGARHARGFVLAAQSLPCGGKHWQRLLALAELCSTMDLRQSVKGLYQLARYGAIPDWLSDTALFAIACLFSDARSNASHIESLISKR